jgi:hypothetical protein
VTEAGRRARGDPADTVMPPDLVSRVPTSGPGFSSDRAGDQDSHGDDEDDEGQGGEDDHEYDAGMGGMIPGFINNPAPRPLTGRQVAAASNESHNCTLCVHRVFTTATQLCGHVRKQHMSVYDRHQHFTQYNWADCPMCKQTFMSTSGCTKHGRSCPSNPANAREGTRGEGLAMLPPRTARGPIGAGAKWLGGTCRQEGVTGGGEASGSSSPACGEGLTAPAQRHAGAGVPGQGSGSHEDLCHQANRHCD